MKLPYKNKVPSEFDFRLGFFHFCICISFYSNKAYYSPPHGEGESRLWRRGGEAFSMRCLGRGFFPAARGRGF